MLNLSGVDLMLPDPEGVIERFIATEIPTTEYRPWLRDSWPGFGTAGIAYPTGHRPDPSFRLNYFRWPTGARRWAYGHFLASSDQMDEIWGDSAAEDGSLEPVDFLFGTPETGEAVETEVYLLPPTPLSGIRGLTGLIQSLYLLTIVDERYFWHYANVGNLQIDSSTEWSDLYTKIGEILSIDLTWDSIDSAYLQPSTSFNLPYENVPAILDAIAANLGHRIVRYYDGSVRAQSFTTAYSAMTADFAANSSRIITAGGFRSANPS